MYQSFNDALKDAEGPEQEGGAEGRESFLQQTIGKLSVTRGGSAAGDDDYAVLGDGADEAGEGGEEGVDDGRIQ